MFVNGKKIAEDIRTSLRAEVERLGRELELHIIQVGDNAVSTKYVSAKKKFGESLGIRVEQTIFKEDTSEEEIIDFIASLENTDENLFRGVIVQLPIMTKVDVDRVLNTIPLSQDVDMLSAAAREAYTEHISFILPPVVAAIKQIFRLHDVEVEGKKVAIVGHGRLVGQPSAHWLESEGGKVTILKQNDPLDETLEEADIVVSGTGVAGLIKPDMLKSGVVLIDVGTSDEGGELRGDIDLRCATKASLFSPVPGGVGPITMAMLFANLVQLAQISEK
ncbi:MAG: bifunctional 5,10-methylenetetrahydrofolate dehydrogenase/5,10-methenyltetrahydrofolate cyclohydrolase [Candidatus Vogelbacteria bacterium]|nr:bifunctional 5,10-methylenetetrahydrofolate dehydrogenase/5,10-methenyltetrahydrofolate cyclohydrolase [Candidatus Vogelbacteria bacterium]